MADIETNLYTKLTGTAGVSALVGTRVYPFLAPQEAVLPYIIYQTISNVPVNQMAGAHSGTDNNRIQIDSWASTYAGAKALAAAVLAALDGWRDTTLTPKVQGCTLLLAQDQPNSPEFGKDDPIYRVIQDWSVWYSTN